MTVAINMLSSDLQCYSCRGLSSKRKHEAPLVTTETKATSIATSRWHLGLWLRPLAVWLVRDNHGAAFFGKVLHYQSASISTQVYQWAPVNLIPGITLRWNSISSGRE